MNNYETQSLVRLRALFQGGRRMSHCAPVPGYIETADVAHSDSAHATWEDHNKAKDDAQGHGHFENK